MDDAVKRPLFVFEMANNHMGRVEHGLRMIREVAEVRSRTVPAPASSWGSSSSSEPGHVHTPILPERSELKYVKRFSETRLEEDDFRCLKEEMVQQGFTTVCTPFDESSVDLIESLGFSLIKIASCSFTDWPLLAHRHIGQADHRFVRRGRASRG